MANLVDLDKLDKLYIVWAFLFHAVFIVHFAIRKPLMDVYTLKYGWIVYLLCIPAAIISILLLRGGKSWPFWAGGFIFIIFAVFGFIIDYQLQIPWRNPLRLSIMFPYVILYLSTVMFYWWPLGMLSRPLWFVGAVLFIAETILNVTSH